MRICRQLAAELGIPGLFDVHVHFMHPQVIAKVWAYFDGRSVARAAWPVHVPRHRRRARRAAARDGRATVLSSLSYAHKPGIAGFMNDWTREFAERTPDTLLVGDVLSRAGGGDVRARS